MRRTALFLIFLVVISGTAVAFPPNDVYLDTTAVIAWLEGQTINVALANTGNNRSSVTLSTGTVDSWGRPIFTPREVSVPGRTIVVETISFFAPGRGQELKLRATRGYRTVAVPIQTSDLVKVKDYIVPANTDLEVTAYLDVLMQNPAGTRLIIDEFYQTEDWYDRGEIWIKELGGGVRQIRSRNSVALEPPYLILGMKTPRISGFTTLTFSLRKEEVVGSWRTELLEGPVIFVYGRNMRFAGQSSTSGETGRIPR